MVELKEDFLPGNIVIANIRNDAIYFQDPMPVYGLILPKEKFIEFYKAEKGNLPAKSFLSEEDSVGIKTLGKVYSDNLERILGFEIINTRNLLNYELKELRLINQIRNFTFMETGINHNRRIIKNLDLDFDILLGYFSGRFKGQPSKELKYYQGSYTSYLIQLLRKCSFKEDSLND